DGAPRFLPGTTTQFPVCFGPQCFVPQCTTDACAKTARTLVTAPDGTREKYFFGNSWQYDEGKLRRIEHQAADGTVLESVTYSYDLSRAATPTYPARYGTS